jgi:hypothetical protein
MSATLQARALSLTEYQARLEAIIRSLGFSFTLNTDILAQQVEWPNQPYRVSHGYASRGGNDGVAGQSNGEARTVVVRDDLSPLDIARTTTHELAHIILGHNNPNPRDDALLLLNAFGVDAVRGAFESEAEACANAVLDYFGFADPGWTDNYIHGWMSHVPPIHAVMDNITNKAAHGAAIITNLINAGTS